MAARGVRSSPERLEGPLTIETMAETQRRLRLLEDGETLDMSAVTAFDTAGAWAILQAQKRVQAAGRRLELVNLTEAQGQLIETVARAMPEPEKRRRTIPGRPDDGLAHLGRDVAQGLGTALNALGFLGEVVAHLFALVLHPTRLRLTPLVHHMQEAGWNAVPIVSLMGFLIGIVLAFQGSTQLKPFGAEVYVVDLVAISILRELGILLTAIIVAGRSASAFTAAIGSMKMREEIDAMRVLGLDPIDRLVLPRVLALVILLPALGFIASMAGLVGGGLMAWIDLGITPGMFRTQLLANTDVSHAIIGLVKAPFFAVIIAVIGCHQGMQVAGNAESLGQHTSRSVVQAIFLVIVIDALFSIFFAVWGL
ncbi:MlaE family lipid ABC transporter permease subunit [Rhodobacter sp. CZR27]|uniref:ABC transporter permease n=1 Tax=Rhodobacter sp. CZR27 TaxID=2033869 RepID=UPI0018E07FB7|nr:MlaE family lipid ABC transporter permease subunit [Rhodobacter sp. CZR27]